MSFGGGENVFGFITNFFCFDLFLFLFKISKGRLLISG